MVYKITKCVDEYMHVDCTSMVIVIFDSLAISHKSLLVQVVLAGTSPKTELS